MTELAASTKAAVPQHELDTDAVGILRLPLLQTCSVAHSGHGGWGGGWGWGRKQDPATRAVNLSSIAQGLSTPSLPQFTAPLMPSCQHRSTSAPSPDANAATPT
jgi:hypothetical protein